MKLRGEKLERVQYTLRGRGYVIRGWHDSPPGSSKNDIQRTIRREPQLLLKEPITLSTIAAAIAASEILRPEQDVVVKPSCNLPSVSLDNRGLRGLMDLLSSIPS